MSKGNLVSDFSHAILRWQVMDCKLMVSALGLEMVFEPIAEVIASTVTAEILILSLFQCFLTHAS